MRYCSILSTFFVIFHTYPRIEQSHLPKVPPLVGLHQTTSTIIIMQQAAQTIPQVAPIVPRITCHLHVLLIPKYETKTVPHMPPFQEFGSGSSSDSTRKKHTELFLANLFEVPYSKERLSALGVVL